MKEHFKDIGRPELLHRINTDNIVPFNFIKDTVILKMIINSKLKNLRERLKEKFNITNVKFEDDSVIDIIIKQHDKTSGGRGILNILNSKVIEPLLFLRQREIVHFNRFQELYNYYKDKGYKEHNLNF